MKYILIFYFLSKVKACDSNEYMCTDGECIRDSWRCDGEVDCNNGSDEEECHTGRWFSKLTGFYTSKI